MNNKTIRKLMSENRVTEVKGKCYFCGAKVNGMFYCFGCEHFVCPDCESSDPPMGKHSVADHEENQ